MELAINILLALLSTYILYEYYKCFFVVKGNSVIRKGILCVYATWQILSVPSIINISPSVRIILGMTFGFAVAACFVGPLLGKIFFLCLYYGMWTIIELLIGSFFLLANIGVEDNLLFGMLLCELYLLVLVKLLQMFFRHEAVRNVKLKESGTFLMIPISFMMVSYFIFTVCAEIGSKTYFVLAISVFILLMVAMIVVFVMYIKLMESYELKRKSEIYQKELELHTEYIKEKENIISEYNKTKHDLKNNLIYMLELLRNTKYVELEKYIKDIAEVTTLDKSGVANTDNTILDSFINYKHDFATEKGIKFNAKLEIPYNMPFDNGDLCVILGNALDNAIEANLGKDIGNSYINLMMRYGEGNLVIIIENSFDGKIQKKKDGKLNTTKKDKRYHGIGLSSIEKAMLKYNGQMNVETDDKKFKLSIIMHG